MSVSDRAYYAWLLWRAIYRETHQSDVSLANRLAPVLMAYRAAGEPDPPVIRRTA